MKKIEGHPDLRRKDTGIIINTNRAKLESLKERARKEEEKDREIELLWEEIRSLKETLRKSDG